jgi:hypothetical protein
MSADDVVAVDSGAGSSVGSTTPGLSAPSTPGSSGTGSSAHSTAIVSSLRQEGEQQTLGKRGREEEEDGNQLAVNLSDAFAAVADAAPPAKKQRVGSGEEEEAQQQAQLQEAQ